MVKVKTVFVCQGCGKEHNRWQGRCGECGEWNTLVEQVRQKLKTQNSKLKRNVGIGRVVRLGDLKVLEGTQDRVSTGSGEFDRVLGGGIVPGSVVLVAGEPGIGKSTLLTQLALRVGQESKKQETRNKKQKSVLYVCGEESAGQVGLRVQRLLGMTNDQLSMTNLLMLAETDVDVVVATAEREKPGLVVVDSVQTLHTGDLSGMAGSVGQVRESTNRLIAYAKRSGTALFLVGHVTKGGSIAGPKVLEHMVDAVLTIEGEKTGLWRILRAYKNRFGATDEVGVFAMDEGGMMDVKNPSGAFLEENQQGKPGSVVVAVMEGTRPVLVEVQALAVRSQLAMPRRVTHGVSLRKVQLLAAVLTKQCQMRLGEMDIFVNVAGGLAIKEPAADLGIALAIASSVKNRALVSRSVMVGEVGLLGEVRRVPFLKKRIAEAKSLGYGKVVGPGEVKTLAGAVKGFL